MPARAAASPMKGKIFRRNIFGSYNGSRSLRLGRDHQDWVSKPASEVRPTTGGQFAQPDPEVGLPPQLSEDLLARLPTDKEQLASLRTSRMRLGRPPPRTSTL